MSEKTLIAILEDDFNLAALIKSTLIYFGYEAVTYSSARRFMADLNKHAPALCIIDLVLPDVDGFHIVDLVRQTTGAGIIIVTGREAIDDRVLGLNLGADDYVTKPFEIGELVARVRSILRRRPHKHRKSNARIAKFGKWAFDIDSHTLESTDGIRYVLSRLEGDILKRFLDNPFRIIEREKLSIYQTGGNLDRAIDVRICRLRKKIDGNPNDQTFIRTVYGTGYIFSSDVIWAESKSR